MVFPFTRWQVLSALVLLIALVLLFPTLAAAWQVNLANVQIARALSLPLDAPDRFVALANAASAIEIARTGDAMRALPPIPARFALAQARWFALTGDLSKTASVVEGTSALDPDFIARMLAASAAYLAGDANRAYAHWRAAGAFEYFVRNAYRALDKHLWNEAEYDARIAAGIVPSSAEAWYAFGDALAWQNAQNSEALTALARAETLTQDQEFLSTIISRRGEILAEQGKLDDALAEFERARNVAPLDARPRTDAALAMVRRDPNARQSAIEILQQTLADAPWYSAAYIAAANIAESEKKVQDAERWLKWGLEKNPNDAHLLFELGQFYARLKRFDDARAALLRALERDAHADDLLKISRALEALSAR